MSDHTRHILLESNTDLLREIERLLALLSQPVSAEMERYRQTIYDGCEAVQQEIEINLGHVKSKPASALSTLLSETQRLNTDLVLYNRHFMGPLRRQLPEDRLPLRLLQWLYDAHAVTRNIPVGLTNSEFQVWPETDKPTLYGLPVSMQHSLLYLPVLFHEFGHQLFTCYGNEMYRFISDLQKEIETYLTPWTQGSDEQAARDRSRRKAIVATWFTWCEELFCDAIGLTIGGPAYLYALDRYVRLSNRGEYHIPRHKLAYRDHPIFRLRMKLLVHQAKRLGCTSVADQVEQTWHTLASAFQVPEDYYGFYEDDYFPIIQTTLTKMIQEVGPYRFTPTDLSPAPWTPTSTPVHLLNQAWTHFLTTPDHYPDWERARIKQFCE